MMKKTKRFLRHFTLVELIMSMGVFLVLLTLLLNFFSGTRQVWKTLRERNDAYSNARIAMDLMSELVSCSVASDKMVGFHFGSKSDGNNSCTFITNSNRTLEDTEAANGGLGLYVVKLYLDEGSDSDPNGFLRMNAVPAGKADASNFTSGSIDKTALSIDGTGKLIIGSVSGLTFTKLTTTTDSNSRPMAIEITLKLFDNQDNYLTWRNMKAKNDSGEKNFRAAHEYTFSRVISFDDIEEGLL